MASAWYSPDPELALISDQIAFFFHVMIGSDPVGDFQAVDNISASCMSYSVAEGGRNHSPHELPFGGPRRRGELTLRWGMLYRSKLYEWFQSVELGYGFRRDVYIMQLTRQKLPLRLMRLSQAWPVSWVGSNLDSNTSSYAVEQITLAYEDFSMVINKALLAMAMVEAAEGGS